MNYGTDRYDVIGIGFGPANIAVAIAMEEMGFPYRVKFFEKEPLSAAIWQKEMLIEHSDIQNHPLRDLVTPRNPRSKYTFVNYLFEHGRLYEHLNLGMYFPYRMEYAKYVSWVAGHFNELVCYDTSITGIRITEEGNGDGPLFCVTDAEGREYFAAGLVLAPGRSPFIPAAFRHLSGPLVCHISQYLQAVQAVTKRVSAPNICVVGGSQSAVEAMLHLSDAIPDARITGVLRNFGYRLKDSSPFTGEVYFPEFVDLFYHASPTDRRRLSRDLHYTNYSAVDGDVLDRLYRKIYMQKLTDNLQILIHRMAEITEARAREGQVELCIRKLESPDEIQQRFDLVILATGFKNMGGGEDEEDCPMLLRGICRSLQYEEGTGVRIGVDYRVGMRDTSLGHLACYLNGLCESSHGMGDAGSFSLLSLRSQVIVNSLMKCLSERSRAVAGDAAGIAL